MLKKSMTILCAAALILTITACQNGKELSEGLSSEGFSSEYASSILPGDEFEQLIHTLSGIPEKYTAEDAKKDGVFVLVHGTPEANLETVSEFIECAEDGKESNLTIFQYTVEGDPIITSLHYDGSKYYGVTDTSRDEFKGDYSDFQEFSYPHLKVFALSENGAPVPVDEESEETDASYAAYYLVSSETASYEELTSDGSTVGYHLFTITK